MPTKPCPTCHPDRKGISTAEKRLADFIKFTVRNDESYEVFNHESLNRQVIKPKTIDIIVK